MEGNQLKDHEKSWLLSVINLSMNFDQTQALDRVSIEFESGKIHGIIGHNGAGKSTLLQILSGAIIPSAGGMSLQGELLSIKEPADAISKGIVCVYQELALPVNLKVYQCLFLGREASKLGFLDKKFMHDATKALCAAVGLDVKPDDVVGTLSVADRQLLEIASAIGKQARVLLLDEPTTALEPSQVKVLFSTIGRIVKEKNIAVILVDHRLDEILSVCDKVTTLTDGKLVSSELVEDLTVEKLTTYVVGNSNKIESSQAGYLTGKASSNSSVELLSISNLKEERLEDISISLSYGEVLGIYGLNGSGRSRLLKVLYGDLQKQSGLIFLDGKEIDIKSPLKGIQTGFAFLSEERKRDGFIPLMTASENIVLPIIRNFMKYFFFIDHKKKSKFGIGQLGDLKVRGNLFGPIMHLSGGNQQKVLFAKVLAQNPRVLLLDEPTKGIDIGAKSEIYRVIKDAARIRGIGVLVVSSEEEEILSLADSVVIMKSGKCDGKKYPTNQYSVATLRELALT
jgi:ABC-type sugar transport system ATPase subunit